MPRPIITNIEEPNAPIQPVNGKEKRECQVPKALVIAALVVAALAAIGTGLALRVGWDIPNWKLLAGSAVIVMVAMGILASRRGAKKVLAVLGSAVLLCGIISVCAGWGVGWQKMGGWLVDTSNPFPAWGITSGTMLLCAAGYTSCHKKDKEKESVYSRFSD